MTTFTDSDIGLHGDSGFGMAHVYEVLADLVEEFDPGKAIELREINGKEFDSEIAEECLVILNDLCAGPILWEFDEGDLVLRYAFDEFEDATVTPAGPLGSRLSVACFGKFVGEVPDEDSARTLLRDLMEREQYNVNAWFVSDHGNLAPFALT